MTTVVTRGAASAQALGYASSSAAVNYVEDVFSTYLYPSVTGDNQVVNGIDLSTKSGLVWIKSRTRSGNHFLIDTVRGSSSGNTNALSSNTSNAQSSGPNLDYLNFNANGFTAKAVAGGGELGTNTYYGNMVSWTFREQPKFFDIVTYTGTGANRTIAHNLGSVPGAIWVKRTDAAANWQCYHRSLANTEYMVLNSTDTVATNTDRWNSTTPTSSVFSLGTNTTVNASGGTYVAYIFAHNAGGFGLSGTDNVISCGSYTGTGTTTGPFVNLGYEPQWIIVKRVGAQNWLMLDTMRYWTVGTGGGFSNGAVLQASGPDAEGGVATYAFPTSTGFQVYDTQINASGVDFIYIAIRRGPMKVPTDATKVFNALVRTGTGTTATVSGFGFTPDMLLARPRDIGVPVFFDRLRGTTKSFYPDRTDAENTSNGTTQDLISFNMDGMTVGIEWFTQVNRSGSSIVNYPFKRAPGFFDEVCYTGTGAGSNAQTHNLGAVPELIITKLRTGGDTSGVGGWGVYAAALGATNVLELNLTTASAADNWFNATPTATTFYVFGNDPHSNRANGSFVAYLFATCPGVSKVGSYIGTGTTQQINCGFTAGSRFVLIKRTDSTGDWYVWDSARGIVAGNDPFLLLNSTAAEDTGTDYVDTYSAGFEISSTAPAAINANGGSFIFLAIA